MEVISYVLVKKININEKPTKNRAPINGYKNKYLNVPIVFVNFLFELPHYNNYVMVRLQLVIV